jgi:hypothetical protein
VLAAAAGCSSDGGWGGVVPTSGGPAAVPAPTVTVTSLYDLGWGAACEGGAVADAAAYDPAGTVKVAAFARDPVNPYWLFQSVGHGMAYFVDESSFTEVSVVACFDATPNHTAGNLDCDGFSFAPVSVHLAFRAAATGETLADSEFTVTADQCPVIGAVPLPDRIVYAIVTIPRIQQEIEGFLATG